MNSISSEIDEITRLNKKICTFWSQSHGWASHEAAELLSRSRLDLQVSLSVTLHYWVDRNGPGDLVLGWANLGALVEGTMKWFLAVFYQDYAQDPNARRDRNGNLIDPDELKLEQLRQFFQKRLDHIYDKHSKFINLTQHRRNGIHTFKAREMGTHDELLQGIFSYHAMLEDVDGGVPYP